MPPPQHFVVDQNWPFGTKISHLGPKKNPGHGEKSKMAILVLFGSRRSLGEKETDLYNDSCPTVFNLYDIYPPQTST